MKKIKILLLFSLIFILTGCYNYREINDLAITSGLGIDKNENGYDVVAQVVNTENQGSKNSSGKDSSSFIVYTNSGKTLQTAYRNMVNESGKSLYVSHIQLVVISEEVAKNGIENILDLFMRDNDFRKQVLVIISKQSAKETLSTITSLITINVNDIKEILNNNEKFLSEVKVITLEELISDYLSKTKEIVIPSFNIENISNENENANMLKETENKAKLKYDNTGIFKDNKLVGYLNKDESVALNIIKGDAKNFLVGLKCDENNYYTLEFMNTSTDIKSIKNSLNFEINFKAKPVLTEMNCGLNVEKNKVIEKLEKQASKYIKELLENTITNVQNKYNTDIFNFRDKLYKTNTKYYEKIKDKYYEEHFKNIKVKIKTDIKILSRGNIIKEINQNE